ncbi:MAG: hypothetical protein ABIQ66_00465 [Novosphingobium sp.]
MIAALPLLSLGGFYQFGYVTRNLDAALVTLRDTFGITRVRRKHSSPTMESLHAWVGTTMIEVLQLSEGAPQMYFDYLPETVGELRLQHLGYRVATLADWDELNAAAARLGLAVPLYADMMEGQLKACYFDTRALLGHYTEFVYLAGAMAGMYDDVPQNMPLAMTGNAL